MKMTAIELFNKLLETPSVTETPYDDQLKQHNINENIALKIGGYVVDNFIANPTTKSIEFYDQCDILMFAKHFNDSVDFTYFTEATL